MQDYRNLEIWRLAHEITLTVYKETRQLPKEETYGLTVQMRRCSTSIPANIAEGCARSSDADFCRFLHIALGSLAELSYFILLCQDLEYISRDTGLTLEQRLDTLRKKTITLIRRLTPTT